ncbi:MAG: ferritin-like domain-containing protein [Bacteroidetes bacterium]|nr:ferritin-like domain-containing protein [Bacteroidota bacterium]
MDLRNIFNAIETTDPEIYERLNSRREVMHRFTNMGGKIALTALPFALGSMLNKAYSQTPTDIISILNFALTLEYLESEFYASALSASSLVIPDSEAASFNLIQQQEAAHVNFLTNTITGLGGTPATKPVFDFTGSGTYPTVFNNFGEFLALAQTFEDTGVRAYKGQLTGLIANNSVLMAAMQIQAVEARHAAHVRRIRNLNGTAPNECPWITGNDTSEIGSSVQASYNGEENVSQLGIDTSKLPGATVKSATECFDEPLTMDDVMAIIGAFII